MGITPQISILSSTNCHSDKNNSINSVNLEIVQSNIPEKFIFPEINYNNT
ncbi:4067_t:CDS:2 [Ambispora leptoticha]|uniref:4067_t:CDS:1 n=1 Tax=Ambispora leptoticha TaxID=144679 RepID=A0A9N8ZUU0_9GLOM|nr:4067_t:CDS:2 [Ambispora leptoticha]